MAPEGGKCSGTVTPEMIAAGVDLLTTEFGNETENPLVDFDGLARRLFLDMLAQAQWAVRCECENKHVGPDA